MNQVPTSDQTKLDQRLRPVLESLERFEVMDVLHNRQKHTEPNVEENLLHRQQDAELSRRLSAPNGADVAQLLEMLPGETRHRVWRNLSATAAGALMKQDFIALPEDNTVADVIATLRSQQQLQNQTDQVFVCDEYQPRRLSATTRCPLR